VLDAERVHRAWDARWVGLSQEPAYDVHIEGGKAIFEGAGAGTA